MKPAAIEEPSESIRTNVKAIRVCSIAAGFIIPMSDFFVFLEKSLFIMSKYPKTITYEDLVNKSKLRK